VLKGRAILSWPLPEYVEDPVHQARYTLSPHGDDLTVETWLEPGGELPEHFHPAQQERWAVVEGTTRFKVDGRPVVLTPEDGELVVEPGVRHALKNTTDREAHLRTEVVPAMGLQGFLEEASAAAREGLYTRRGIPKGFGAAVRLAKLLDDYSDEVVMTQPPPLVQRLTLRPLLRFAR
jgi:quercetin dioxygenase-like cupin family protein